MEQDVLGAVGLLGAKAAPSGKDVGSKVAGAPLPTSFREATMQQAFESGASKVKPTTLGETMTEFGISGTNKGIGVKAKKAQTELWKTNLGPKVKNSTSKVSVDELKAELMANAKSKEIASVRKGYEEIVEDIFK